MKTLLLVLLLVSTAAYPFTLNNGAGAAFKTDIIKVNIAAHTCTNIGITNSELLSIAEEAVQVFWNRIPTSKLELAGGSITTVASDFQTGQVCVGSTSNCEPTPALVVSSNILISCNTNATNYSGSNEVLGVTVPNNISGSDIKGALILVNDRPGNSFLDKSHSAKVSIIAHEIGHAIGLGHSPFKEALMYAQFVEGRDRLAQDDMTGATWLYPVEEPNLGICGQVSLDGSGQAGPSSMILGFLIGLIIILGKKWSRAYKRKLRPLFWHSAS